MGGSGRGSFGPRGPRLSTRHSAAVVVCRRRRRGGHVNRGDAMRDMREREYFNETREDTRRLQR